MERVSVIIANNVRKAMAEKFDGEISQSLLSRISGVSQKTISNILSIHHASAVDLPGSHSTSVKIIEQLAEVFDLEPWMLLHPSMGRTE